MQVLACGMRGVLITAMQKAAAQRLGLSLLGVLGLCVPVQL